MTELELKYGCNPNQKPARIFMESGDLPLQVLNGKPGYINLLDALNSWQLVKELKAATGLPAAGQKTTARDMVTLSRAYLRAHPGAMRFHSTRFFLHRGRTMRNTNALLGTVAGVNGLKTGWTVASGYNIVVTAQRGKTRLLAVVLGGNTKDRRDASARRLIEAGFRHPSSPKQVRHALGRRR